MSYTAPPILNFSMPMVSVYSLMGTGPGIRLLGGAIASGTVLSANQAMYVPIRIPAGVLVKRLWVQVGTTGGTDTFDLGIYTDGGVQIVHMGSTTAGTASTIQFMDITDTYLAPGPYYFAWSRNGTTATVSNQGSTALVTAAIGILNQATAHPLPATATFAAATTTSLPFMGYCTTATP